MDFVGLFPIFDAFITDFYTPVKMFDFFCDFLYRLEKTVLSLQQF